MPSTLRSAACPHAALHEAAVTIMQAAALRLQSFSLFRPHAHAHSRTCSPAHSTVSLTASAKGNAKSSSKALFREQSGFGSGLGSGIVFGTGYDTDFSVGEAHCFAAAALPCTEILALAHAQSLARSLTHSYNHPPTHSSIYTFPLACCSESGPSQACTTASSNLVAGPHQSACDWPDSLCPSDQHMACKLVMAWTCTAVHQHTAWCSRLVVFKTRMFSTLKAKRACQQDFNGILPQGSVLSCFDCTSVVPFCSASYRP